MSARPAFIPEADWELVTAAAREWGVDPYIMAAVGWHETHWGQLGAGRPESGGYIFGYGVPSSGKRLTQYAGKPAQIKALAKRLRQWGDYLGHPVGSLSDLQAFAAGRGPSAPLPWAPSGNGGPPAWAQSVASIYGSLPGSGPISSGAGGPIADPGAQDVVPGWGISGRKVGLWLAGFAAVGVGLVALVKGGGVDDTGREIGAALKGGKHGA